MTEKTLRSDIDASDKITLTTGKRSAGLGIDLFGENRSLYTDWSREQAHEIADWIKTNVPAPAPVDPYAEARAAFDALEIGDTFHFGSSGKDRRHQKVSATGFRYDWGYGAALEDFPSEVEDYLHHGVVPNPKPTVREQIEALPEGQHFTLSTNYETRLFRRGAGNDVFEISTRHHSDQRFGLEQAGMFKGWTRDEFALADAPKPPTIREQVNALPDGTPFTATGSEGHYGPVGRYIKLETDSVWARTARKVWDLYSERWNGPGTVTISED